ncbi:MAG: aspartate aminotransferase family protein [Arenicellales bacterium]|jgi:glutamate-1-semialdehyde 2,1-aminomutase|nr:glutamate-1-semialdehyde 2,1-aminomutase [Gammaproteobacteria bacterium]MDP6267334.1 aspartate aminotransferase family protein [Arenicellales bacterium]|tara:strand:+ start:437 stop:1783 length:1347 start_codon:yes stop_codon:yes gene_type:complete
MKLSLEKATKRFTDKYSTSAEMAEEATKYIPGGGSRSIVKVGPHAIFVESGEGAYVQTVDGHSLCDFHNNFSANVLGHNHPEIRKAIEEVCKTGFSFGNATKHEFELARILCERIESVDRAVFMMSGTEACMAAATLSRAFTGKGKIAKLEGGYHGTSNDFWWSIHPDAPDFIHCGLETNPKPSPESMGVPEALRGNTLTMPQNDLTTCSRIIRENARDLAAVILELQSGAGGLITLEKSFVEGLRELTQELGIVLIFDEVISFRMDEGGLQKIFGVKPDLTTMGKAIGGGLPIGAVGGADEIMKLNESGQVFHSGTHHGHVLSCAAGVACLNNYTQPLIDKMNQQGQKIKTDLKQFVEEKNYPVNLTGIGSAIGFEMLDEPGRSIRSCRDIMTYCNEEASQTFNYELITRGYLPMWSRGQVVLCTPLTDDDISGFIDTSKAILEDIY